MLPSPLENNPFLLSSETLDCAVRLLLSKPFSEVGPGGLKWYSFLIPS